MKVKESEIISHIDNGTVIDHIPPGQALTLIDLLNLKKHSKRLTIGVNLLSTSRGTKDLIKIEERELTPDEANSVALFASDATISIIRNQNVFKKFKVALPEIIQGCIACPNARCITNHEDIQSYFFLKQRTTHTQLCCKYCGKTFTQAEIIL